MRSQVGKDRKRKGNGKERKGQESKKSKEEYLQGGSLTHSSVLTKRTNALFHIYISETERNGKGRKGKERKGKENK